MPKHTCTAPPGDGCLACHKARDVFVDEYRALCNRLGMEITLASHDGEFFFAVAWSSPGSLDRAASMMARGPVMQIALVPHA